MILEKELYNSISETKSFFKSLYTFLISSSSSIFNKPKKTQSAKFRGLPTLSSAKDCTGCSDCVEICPTNCLTIELNNDRLVKMNLNVLACTFCGLCAEVCADDLISLSGTRPLSSHFESRWTIDLVSENEQ
ncbi:4Fe-4S dicluster domain-containing protein [Halobacteriovorax sp. HLS]|uniref:4Fe-4S dicluster domain-containing protein n=1 Tax=Halobacteriovorax sp. HLS TaxID=2234000 RepID=UPI000FD72F0A|nr:4Fe-4S dicluster domain-containing protein [Halobacteriovorax sp. HLS]